jgi:hypothetical protein
MTCLRLLSTSDCGGLTIRCDAMARADMLNVHFLLHDIPKGSCIVDAKAIVHPLRYHWRRVLFDLVFGSVLHQPAGLLTFAGRGPTAICTASVLLHALACLRARRQTPRQQLFRHTIAGDQPTLKRFGVKRLKRALV